VFKIVLLLVLSLCSSLVLKKNKKNKIKIIQLIQMKCQCDWSKIIFMVLCLLACWQKLILSWWGTL